MNSFDDAFRALMEAEEDIPSIRGPRRRNDVGRDGTRCA